jgi:hypothetical protein
MPGKPSFILAKVLRSRSRKQLHHFGGAGDVTRCGSGIKLNDENRWMTREGAGAASKILPGAGAA